MFSPFYTHGLIYRPDTEQILLCQKLSDAGNVEFVMFGRDGKKNELPEQVFQSAISELLQITLHPKQVLPVYDFFHTARNVHYYVFYGIYLNKSEPVLKKNGYMSAWYSFKELGKLKLPPQMKQDIVVTQRVISAYVREHTAEIVVGE